MAFRTILGENRILSDQNTIQVARKTFSTFKGEPKKISKPKLCESVSETKNEDCDIRVQELPQPPPGVPNIDDTEEVTKNPQLCAEYAPYLYSYLRQLEGQFQIRKNFLQGFHINARIRGILIDWLVEVHAQFKLLQETLYLTIFLLDRYMQLDGINVKRDGYQLVGVTAMFTASKIEEMYPPEIRDFVYITDNSYSAAQIRQTELRILTVLKFGVSRPLPLHFLRRYSKAGDVDILQHTLAKYLVELAQVEYDLAHLNPSQLSAASLYLSLLLLTPEPKLDVWSPTLEWYSQYKKHQLLPIISKLAVIAHNASSSKLKAVFKKYCSRSKLKIALLSELQGARIKLIGKEEFPGMKMNSPK